MEKSQLYQVLMSEMRLVNAVLVIEQGKIIKTNQNRKILNFFCQFALDINSIN